MRKFLDEYFTFTKRDRNGVLWLCLILVSAIAYRLVVRQFPEDPVVIQIQHSEPERDEAPEPFLEKDNSELTPFTSKNKEVVAKYFHFDPNTLEAEGWADLGFSEKQVSMILRYRYKGGKFAEAKDILKLYCIDQEKFAELEPWIKIASESFPREVVLESSKKISSESFELNTADTNQLKTVRGIGSFYARKIIELRDQLQGYHSWDQLLEIWKMKPETIESLREAATLDSSLIQTWAINDQSIEQLADHPYISWKQAKAIVAYREQHGEYSDWSDLFKCHLVDSAFRVELKPYFGFDDRRSN